MLGTSEVAAIAFGLLAVIAWLLMRIEGKLTTIVEELRFTNEDGHSREFYKAVDAEQSRSEDE